MKNKVNRKVELLGYIKRVILKSEELSKLVRSYSAGDMLFPQGRVITHLYLVLEGSVTLNHQRDDGISLELISLAPGHFAGLVSYTTGNATLTKCIATEDSKIFRVRQTEFTHYMDKYPELRRQIEQLMLNNMAERFDKNLKLESKLNALNLNLEQERTQLKKAFIDLENSHQKLVAQEKMATLGELVAGFAHEVNNPAAALLRSSEKLKENFLDSQNTSAKTEIFNLGLHSKPLSSSDVRAKMLSIQKEFPWVKERSLIRKLAQMPDEALEIVKKKKKKIPVEVLVQQFDAGKFIHNIQVASERIVNLVKSLKSYSRQDRNQFDMIDIREGIYDTILILSNRLKYLNVELDLLDIPQTCGKMGELNQVWTNILVNACDVLTEKGNLKIKTWAEGDFKIVVEISDNGPGIPEDVLPKIFEPNFTTKNQGAKFGLGLGLAISNEIIRQHGGFIKAFNNEAGGATFQIILPVKEC